jgi:hypothetical protein
MHIRAYRQIPQVKAVWALTESLTASSDSWATTFGNTAFPKTGVDLVFRRCARYVFTPRLCARSRVLFLVTRQKRDEATEWPGLAEQTALLLHRSPVKPMISARHTAATVIRGRLP